MLNMEGLTMDYLNVARLLFRLGIDVHYIYLRGRY